MNSFRVRKNGGLYSPGLKQPWAGICQRLRLTAPVDVTGNVRVAGNQLFVNGHIRTGAQVECDRCLKSIELPVITDFALEYVTGLAYESTQAAELTEAEMSVSVFDGEAIDIDEIVKEQILLAVPGRMLCRED